MDTNSVKAQMEVLEDHITSLVNKNPISLTPLEDTMLTMRAEQASSLEFPDVCELTGVEYEDTEVDAGSPTPRGASWLGKFYSYLQYPAFCTYHFLDQP